MIQIIPAAAGYYALWRYLDDGRRVGRAPITSWQVDTNGEGGEVRSSWPITDGESGIAIEAILCPDGTVNESGGGLYWETLPDWIASDQPHAN